MAHAAACVVAPLAIALLRIFAVFMAVRLRHAARTLAIMYSCRSQAMLARMRATTNLALVLRMMCFPMRIIVLASFAAFVYRSAPSTHVKTERLSMTPSLDRRKCSST